MRCLARIQSPQDSALAYVATWPLALYSVAMPNGEQLRTFARAQRTLFAHNHTNQPGVLVL